MKVENFLAKIALLTVLMMYANSQSLLSPVSPTQQADVKSENVTGSESATNSLDKSIEASESLLLSKDLKQKPDKHPGTPLKTEKPKRKMKLMKLGVKAIKKHFSLDNVDSFFGEKEMPKQERNLIAPNENDFTDIESLQSFKNLDFNFEDLHLSPDQEKLHTRINHKFKKSLDLDLYKDSYGFRKFKKGEKTVKSHFSSTNKENKKPEKHEIIPKATPTNKNRFSRKLAHSYHKRAVRTNQLSDLDAFISSGGKTTLFKKTFSKLEEEEPIIDDFPGFSNDTTETSTNSLGMPEYGDLIKDFIMKDKDETPKRTAPKLERRLRVRTASVISDSKSDVFKKQQEDSSLEMFDSGEIDKIADELHEEELKKAETDIEDEPNQGNL